MSKKLKNVSTGCLFLGEPCRCVGMWAPEACRVAFPPRNRPCVSLRRDYSCYFLHGIISQLMKNWEIESPAYHNTELGTNWLAHCFDAVYSIEKTLPSIRIRFISQIKLYVFFPGYVRLIVPCHWLIDLSRNKTCLLVVVCGGWNLRKV